VVIKCPGKKTLKHDAVLIVSQNLKRVCECIKRCLSEHLSIYQNIVGGSYFSFMARYGEHFFMCFLVIWTSSFEKILFS
jgi:hypothetical protein